MSKFDCNNYCNQVLKNEYEWLREVDKFALTNAIFNMDSAYKKFFNNNNIEISFENRKVKLPKLKWVKAKIHREFTGKIKSATISQVPSGKYVVSILVETECMPMKSTGRMVGIDLGIKDLLITSDGEKFAPQRSMKIN